MLSTVFALSGCGGTPAPTTAPAPTLVAPTEKTYSDAEKTALVAENIDAVYCGEEPKPAWCANVHRVGGKPDVLVEGTSLFVATTLADSTKARKLAAQMCDAIATASFDADAKPIGFRHVHIQGKVADVFLADCDVE